MNDQYFCELHTRSLWIILVDINSIMHNFNFEAYYVPNWTLLYAVPGSTVHSLTPSLTLKTCCLMEPLWVHVSLPIKKYSKLISKQKTHTQKKKRTKYVLISFFHPPSRVGRQKSLGVAIQSKGHPYISWNTCYWSRRLDDKSGPKGCILHDTNTPGGQSLPQIHFPWKDIPFRCLPFGLACAPCVFTNILKPLAAQLGQLGMWLST